MKIITGSLLVFLVLIFSPNLSSLSHQTSISIASNLLVVLFILALRPKLYIGLLLLLPLAFLAPLEVIYIFLYGQPSNAHLLGIMIETNPKELASFFEGVEIQLFFLIISILLLTNFIIYKAFKNNWQWQGRIRYWVIITGILASIIFVTQDQLSSKFPEIDTVTENLLTKGDGNLLTSNQLMKSYPLGLIFRWKSFFEQKQGMQDAANIIKDFSFHAKQRPFFKGREIHVLVIGETGRANRWQLNGYHRKTTPRLSSINNVISLSNTITGWAWTRMSVPVIISRKESKNANAFFAEKSIVSAFKEAGFKTYWLSTQGPLGLHESSVALHAQEADETKFLSLTDYKGTNVYDGVLLPPLEEILARKEPKQFIVLHTLGSHYNYSNRYPEEFDKFQPSLKNKKNVSLYDASQKEAMNNSYDNSILYTDFFLSEVIKKLKATESNATLLYSADHGENLFDNNCKISGHGNETESDFRVASIWWNSSSYFQTNPEKIHLIRKRQAAPLTTEHIFHTLLNAADIHYRKEDLTYSILSKKWQKKARWTQTGLDFDLSERDIICNKLIKANHKSPQ